MVKTGAPEDFFNERGKHGFKRGAGFGVGAGFLCACKVSVHLGCGGVWKPY